ncbi:MAG: hypothetical protein LC800_18110 [Acidobacteria bacterium]|nr:hypothetical protein [Acidobacteriota bacterium]
MRLVRITVPEGKGEEVARLALKVGIGRASVQPLQFFTRDGRETREAVDVSVSTPEGKAFIDAVMAAPFFDPAEYSINVREPRSVLSGEGPRRLTRPIVIPETDLYEELWQFSRVTVSFVGRFLVGAGLLSYGMLKFNLLLMIAGLLFLPLLPTLLAMSFGLLARELRLAAQGLTAFACGTALVVAGGLGLAATAQVALIPAWLGISLVNGFSQGVDPTPPARRLLTFGVIVAIIIAASLVTYALLGVRGAGLRRFGARDSA